MLKIAIAKGRILDESKSILSKCSFDINQVYHSRQLRFYNEDSTMALILLKAADIPLYVELGAVDVGIVGKDTVIENDRAVYEVGELNYALCTLCLAGPIDAPPLSDGIKVATKYPSLAKRFLSDKKINPIILPLSGSVEIAPLISLSDYIVDIVQTGDTLRENGLEVYESYLKIKPLIISNQVSFRTKSTEIQSFIKLCEEK